MLAYNFLVLLVVSVFITVGIVALERTPSPEKPAARNGASTISNSYLPAQGNTYNAAVENAAIIPLPTQGVRGLLQDVTSGAPFSYIFPFNAIRINTEGAGVTLPNQSGAIVPQPASSQKIAPAVNNPVSFDVYSFMPSGLINIPALVAERNPDQQRIFDYGNKIGSYIRTFDSTHMNMTQVLKDFFDDRANKTKAEKVLSLANDYEDLSKQIMNTNSVPKEVEMLHQALARAYGDVAAGLANLTKAQLEADVISAIVAYDAAADEFIKSYVALVEFFSAYGVRFSTGDAGSVFTFSQTSL